MNSNKALIIQLIQADLKHNQLISGLESLHLETNGLYYSNLIDVVAQLMGYPKEKPQAWFTTYVAYMDKAHQYEVDGRSEGLLKVAEECYGELRGGD